jgi:hypothetical protein
LFFINWFAWYRRNLPWWKRPWFFARVLAVWLVLIWERVAIAKGIDADGIAQDANFAATGASSISADIRPRALIELCLSENERRMSGYDTRLLRPTFVPRLAKFALRFCKT